MKTNAMHKIGLAFGTLLLWSGTVWAGPPDPDITSVTVEDHHQANPYCHYQFSVTIDDTRGWNILQAEIRNVDGDGFVRYFTYKLKKQQRADFNPTIYTNWGTHTYVSSVKIGKGKGQSLPIVWEDEWTPADPADTEMVCPFITNG